MEKREVYSTKIPSDDLSQEGAQIYERYKIGPSAAGDSELGLEFSDKDIDCFGFYINRNRSSLVKTVSVTSEGTRKHSKSITEDTSRIVESQNLWLKILGNWNKYYPMKIKSHIFNGIANALRGELWKQILEVPKLILNNKGVYTNLTEAAIKFSEDLRQIDLDINRTFRDHIMFRERYGLKQFSLFRVLAAYTMYDKKVGYCQGMSSVAALLLMFMNEEDAFWALTVLLSGKRHSMHGFFVKGFPKLMRFQIHHENIMKKLLPKLYNHFENEGIMSSLYTLKWYMQCFLDRLPFGLILRLWDVFILEGDKILHPIGYTLLKLHKKLLISIKMDEIGEFLSNGMVNHDYNLKNFMMTLANNTDNLKKHNLYPVPSVVEGELSESLPSMFCSVKERKMIKSEYFGNLDVDDELDSSNVDSDTTPKMTTTSSQSNQIPLPPGIPPPPVYPAPSPGHDPATLNIAGSQNKETLKVSIFKRKSPQISTSGRHSQHISRYSMKNNTDEINSSTFSLKR